MNIYESWIYIYINYIYIYIYIYTPTYICVIERHTVIFGPVTSWQTDGESMETVKDFIFLGSKVTADGDSAMKFKDAYSLEEKLWPT